MHVAISLYYIKSLQIVLIIIIIANFCEVVYPLYCSVQDDFILFKIHYYLEWLLLSVFRSSV